MVPTIGLQAATVTSADAVVVAGFEIDGNTPDDAGAGVDWGTPVGTHATDPVGNIDTTTFKGSKEFEHPSTWERGTGLAPNQDDISDVYFHDEIVDGDIWGYLGFRRFTTSGTTNFDVEFNKLPNAAATTYLPIRSVGDVMVRFEQDGNSAFALTAAWFWTRTAHADWDNGCIEVPGYSPASGWCPQNVNTVPFTGITGETGHFAEGAFNFSTLLEQGGIGDATCEGGDFGTMNIRSFTGNANESALKDYVNPVTIDIDDTCGELEIYKIDQFGNSVGGATWSISPNPIPGETDDPLVVTDGGANDPDGEADGVIVIDPATPGVYTVIETAAPAGYELPPLADRTFTYTVGEGGVGSSDPIVMTDRLFFDAPSIDNTVLASYDIDYGWKVYKSVDRNQADVPQGTSADFNYTVELEALPNPAKTGFEVHGTATVTNPNSLDMLVTLSTNLAGAGACSFPAVVDESADAGLQVTIDAGANVFAYTCTPGGSPADPAVTTATVDWNEATYPSDDPAEDYTVSDQAQAAFTIDVKTDESTTVTDTFNGGSAEDLGTFNWNTVWADADHKIVVKTYKRTLPGVPGECTNYPNTARESADDTSDSETVQVCVGQDLDIDKDASLGFHRTYDWDIAKSGPGTVFVGENEQGDLATMVRFDIDVIADGFHDSAWTLGGTITVDNPNSWAVTGTITDTVEIDTGTLQCTVDGADVSGAPGHQVTVPAEAVNHPFTYTCAGVQQGDYVGTNTATIDWSGSQYPSPNSSDSKTVDVEVTQDADPTNETITITDLLAGSNVTADLPQTSFDWADVNAMEGNTQTITYEVLLGTTAGECTPYKNVVSIDQTEQSADATATICSPGVSKTVEADYGQKQLWDLTKEVDKTDVEISQGGTATFNYTVTATPGQIVDDGTSSWSGTVTVSNPSETEALTVDVTDVPDVEGWTCEFTDDATQVELAAGESAELAYTCSGTGHPSGTNTAQVSFGDDQTVSKTVDVSFDARENVRDSIVTVYDDKTNPDAPPVLLGEADAADGPTEFTYSLVKAGVAGACTTYNNTATAVLEASDDPEATAAATLCVEKPLTIVASGSGNYGVTYPWGIQKDVDKTRVEVAEDGEATFNYTVTVTAGEAQPAGWTLSGDIDVTNPNTYAGGAITLTGATVTTDIGGGADCTATLPDNPVVPVNGSLSVPFDCTFTGDPDTSGEVHAEVTWDPAGPAASATASDDGPATLTIGEETNKVVDVIDDKTNPENPVLLEEDLVWSEGLVKEYEYALSLPGTAGECVDYTNTAIVDLTPEQEQELQLQAVDEDGNPMAQQTVTVCEEAPLGAAVTASADLARAYAWSIAKSVDATTRTVDASGNATFRYTVIARAGQSTDSGWQMSGSVTLTNENQYEEGAITADVTAATTVGGGASCVVTGGNDAVVPAAGEGPGTLTLPITCAFTSQPAASGQLQVTATWDPPGEASSASTSASAPVSFTVRSETNKVVDVVDDKTNPGQRVVLETGVTWAAGLVKTYTYDLAVAGGAAGACATYTNTAKVDQPVGTDPTATATVTACTPEVLPEQAFGKAVGSVKASCQGTVRTKLSNRSGVTVTYKLRVGKKVHKIAVQSLSQKKFTTKGKARAKVVLKAEGRTLDKIRIPNLCAPPEVLPDTGLRATSS